MRLVTSAVGLLLVALATGCGSSRPPEAPQEGMASLKNGSIATRPEATTAPSPRALSDAQVLAAVATANEGEVQMAELAIKRASAPDVKTYATMMKTRHGAAAAKGKTVAAKTKLTPADNDVSTSIDSDNCQALKVLKHKAGKDFDRAYLESQVKAHQEVLDAIDHRLLPNATNGEVKRMLAEMRKTVAHHLTKAGELAKKAP